METPDEFVGTRRLEAVAAPLPEPVPSDAARTGDGDSSGVDATPQRRSGADPGRFAFVASTDAPVRMGYRVETLKHAENNVRMGRVKSGTAPLLWAHDQSDPDNHLGRIDSARIENGKLLVEGQFSRNPIAQQKRQDYDDGIIKTASVGFMVHAYQRVADVTENGQKSPAYEITDWEPREVSLAPVPADPAAVSTRSASAQTPTPRMEITVESTQQPSPEAINLRRTQEIMAVAGDKDFSKYVTLEETRAAIDGNTSADAFRETVMRKMIERHSAEVQRSAGDELYGSLSHSDKKRYSIVRALRAAVNIARPGEFQRDASEATLEREVSAELARRTGQTTAGLLIPDTALATRALGTTAIAAATGQLELTSASGAVSTVTTDEIIRLLRPKPRVIQLGARELNGLTSVMRFPVQTGASTWYWLGEGQTVTPADLTMSSVEVKPRRGSSQSGITMEMIASEAPDMEALIIADMNQIRNLGIDEAALTGSAAGPGPTGILNTTGVQIVTPSGTPSKFNVSGATTGLAYMLSYEDILNFDTLVAEANADSLTSAWMVTPGIRTALRSTQMFPGTYSAPIWQSNNRDPLGLEPGPLTYRAGTTTQLPGNGTAANYTGPGLHTGIFGDWSKIVICGWGATEAIYDPYTQAAAGVTVMTIRSLHDVLVRHAVAFAAATNVAVA